MMIVFFLLYQFIFEIYLHNLTCTLVCEISSNKQPARDADKFSETDTSSVP